ncbi:hypothetical protein CWB85_14640 [Pseudoalteromonas sp. S1727]|uniref:hypothetical protein n=1 Tax=Pseudoalteromonas sp. S1727 TaxID=2066514 RepID=UPI001109FE1F|nr:hypothetical protein [Pseudoalteromonas sp. S1727]TMN70638.1 hypothetical protein CWB85_14640 [Pseudoalteromonas sp. S1727]
MTELNYKNYTLQELLEAQETIDQELFPLRYQQLCTEIKLKQSDPHQIGLVERKEYFNNLIFAKIIMALLSWFLASELYSSWQLGVVSFKKSDYSLADNPQMFFFLNFHELFFVTCFFDDAV